MSYIRQSVLLMTNQIKPKILDQNTILWVAQPEGLLPFREIICLKEPKNIAKHY